MLAIFFFSNEVKGWGPSRKKKKGGGGRPPLHNCPATARPGTSRAAEAMVTGRDLAILDRVRIDIPQEDRRAVLPLQPELLIEIAIVNFASPTHTDGVAAHQPIDRGRIECADEHLHVFVELFVVPQISGKAPDGEIGNGVKLIEHYAEVREELALEIDLHLGL